MGRGRTVDAPPMLDKSRRQNSDTGRPVPGFRMAHRFERRRRAPTGLGGAFACCGAADCVISHDTARGTGMTRNTPRFCFIGCAEAGQAFASGLRGAGVTSMAAWDILFPESQG